MNVLLVHPKFPDGFWSHTHALRIFERHAITCPLGLLTVAAMLPREWGKKLVDLNIRPISTSELAWADMVFIGGMSIQRESAKQTILECKAAGKRIVAGGPLFLNECHLYDELVDHFVLNEAELTLPRFLADLEKGCPDRMYRSREFADLTKSPIPMWELAELDQYATMGVQFSRGCPFDCDFCNVTAMFGRKPRVKTGAQIVAELEALARTGWRGPIFFVDDNLIGHRQSAREDLLPALIQWHKRRGPVQMLTQASINLADDAEMTRMMVEAGFCSVFVGIETPDAVSLGECHKNQNNNRDLVADVHKLQNAGLEVMGGFIVGFDNDTQNIFQRQVDFIQNSAIVTAMVGMLQAPPGTKLFRRLAEQGRLIGHSSGDNAGGSTNVMPTMGLEQLRQGYKGLLREIYSPAFFYRRLKSFLREFTPPKKQTPLNMGHIKIFLRALLQLGVLGKERLQYWGLLAWTLVHRPASLRTAVRLAVCGYHYRKISELAVESANAPITIESL